jgi:hypothetical protein
LMARVGNISDLATVWLSIHPNHLYQWSVI